MTPSGSVACSLSCFPKQEGLFAVCERSDPPPPTHTHFLKPLVGCLLCQELWILLKEKNQETQGIFLPSPLLEAFLQSNSYVPDQNKRGVGCRGSRSRDTNMSKHTALLSKADGRRWRSLAPSGWVPPITSQPLLTSWVASLVVNGVSTQGRPS